MVAWVGGFFLFFVTQLIVGAAWVDPPYSWSHNSVSDLGTVYCQMWAEDLAAPLSSGGRAHTS